MHGRWNHEFSLNRYPLDPPGVSDRRGSSYPAGTRLHGHRRHCNAKSETCRPPSPARDDLFLVPGRGLSDCDRPGCGAWGGGLLSVYSRSIVACGGLFWARGQTDRWRHWARLHISGMGASYVLLLIAFYVDNGKNLPLWKELPPIAYWLLPAAIRIPLIVHALLWHPRVGADSSATGSEAGG